jgi:hypothetical protein
MHGSTYFGKRHPLAFKSHNPTTMGKMLIPRDMIMDAFMAGKVVVAGSLFLVTGHCSGVHGAGYGLRVASCGLRVASFGLRGKYPTINNPKSNASVILAEALREKAGSRSSVLSLPASVFRHLSSVIRLLSSVLCPLSSVPISVCPAQ